MSTVISVENVSKQYRLGEVGTGSLAHDINRWWHRVRGKEDPYLMVGETNDRSKKGESDYAWALRDVSFEVKQGEVLGIIGRNGAGKSTLLKILSRVTRPTSGEIKVKGRIASLLEVGTGFHPELTGRENIFLNGAILGMRKAEIQRKFDEIVDFSGCERYIDTPVKRYSSGMYVRLAFAVAAHLEPEILIVDEVLAVGDADFQRKCLGKMKSVALEGRSILFVSHNIGAIQRLCQTGILLNSGMLNFSGSINIVLTKYQSSNTICGSVWRKQGNKVTERGGIQYIEIDISGDQPQLLLHVSMAIRLAGQRKGMIAIDVKEQNGSTIMQILPFGSPEIDPSSNVNIKFIVDLPPLVPGTYTLSPWLGTSYSDTIEQIDNCVAFEVTSSPVLGRTFPHTTDHGCIVPPISLIKVAYDEDYDYSYNK